MEQSPPPKHTLVLVRDPSPHVDPAQPDQGPHRERPKIIRLNNIQIKKNSFYLHALSLQSSYSIKASGNTFEHTPPVHSRVLCFRPSPQVLLQADHSDHGSKTEI